MSKLSQRINTHQFPPIFLRYPFLIHIVYFLFRLVYQRIGITYWHLEPYLKTLPKCSLVTDAGFGEGQFLFRYAKRFKNIFFEGLDYNENTLKFGQAYQKYFNLQNIELQQVDLTQWKSNTKTLLKDGIFCVGVLHCIKDDEAVLKNFYEQLKVGGWLLIYTPLQATHILNFYKKTMQRFKTYDQTFRTHEYEANDFKNKLQKIGFSIVEQRFTHGTFGIVSYEIYTTLVTLLTQGYWLEKVVSILLLILFFPIILIFKQIDICFHKKASGNALLIVVEKK